MNDDAARSRAGLLLGLGAYLVWGVLPIYFRALGQVAPSEIVAHRILWSLLFLVAVATALRRWPGVRAALTNIRTLATLTLTAVLIAINWLAYIWAVDSGHVIEGSLGYYLNPLVNVAFGVIFLKERITGGQKAAVALAAAGVAVLAIGAGGAIWLSLVIAASFASYGILRKIAPVEALEGLTVETIVLTPAALGWLWWLESGGRGSFDAGGETALLLVASGVVTALPLLMFTAAAKRLPYVTLGFLQYIAPSMQFLIAVLLFREPLTTAHLICFGAIWLALAIFVVETIRSGRAAAQTRAARAET